MGSLGKEIYDTLGKFGTSEKTWLGGVVEDYVQMVKYPVNI